MFLFMVCLMSCYGINAGAQEARLAGSGLPKEGRLEVYYNGTWGTVCDDYFSNVDASVACFTLGFGYSGYQLQNQYGAGSGQIWMDDVTCLGSETSIFNCQHNGWGIHNCVHNEDVSIICNGSTSSPGAQEARLAGSGLPKEGRLEVNYNGTWGTVCDDYFSNVDASVACFTLGFGYSGYQLQNQYGAGTGHIWMDDVTCLGIETSIFNCKHNGWGIHNHNEDVSIICNVSTTSSDVPVARLAGSGSSREGRLEVYYNGTWGTVCDDQFDNVDATVACATLGLGYSGYQFQNRYGAGSGPIWMDDVACVGNEPSIANCQHRGWGVHNCVHNEDVSIICNGTSTAPNDQVVRLAGSGVPEEGRLEVYYNGTWGTVCDDNFANVDASVACFTLGFGYSGYTIRNLYSAGSGRIWMDEVACVGNETSIFNCKHNGWGVHNCGHYDDVSVVCNGTVLTSSNDQVARLVGSSSSLYEGRLEVYYNGTWGTVCRDNFGNIDASVACTTLGFGRTGKQIGSWYGSGTGPIWMDNVYCTGYETSIFNCSHNGWGVTNCQHSQDVSIVCNGTNSTSPMFRLANGGASTQGRLEVYYSGTWGTVCKDSFDDVDATVACQSLHYGYVGQVVGNLYGAGSGMIWLDEVECSGNETSLVSCAHSNWGEHDCQHSDDVSVVCSAPYNSSSSLEWYYILAIVVGSIAGFILLCMLFAYICDVNGWRRHVPHCRRPHCRTCCERRKPKQAPRQVQVQPVVLDTPSYWIAYPRNTEPNLNVLIGQRGCTPRRTKLSRDHQLFQAVLQLVERSCNTNWVGVGRDAVGLTHQILQVKNVFLIEHPQLYVDYLNTSNQLAARQMRGEVIPPIAGLRGETDVYTRLLGILELNNLVNHDVNEYYLFHGTRQDRIKQIVDQGLECRVRHSTGRLFGRGIYLAESASKSDQYADESNQRASRRATLYMFVVRSLLGNVYVCDEGTDFQRPPCSVRGCYTESCQDHTTNAFDSVMGISADGCRTRLRYREFIVYDKRQCYPEFLVEYTRI